MFNKFFSKFSERANFDDEIEKMAYGVHEVSSKSVLSFKISDIFDKYDDFSSFSSKSFEQIDKIYMDLIADLKELYEGFREKLGSEIMKNSNLIELNQLIFALDKNKGLLYKDEFNLEEFLRYQLILINQIKKLE